MKILDTNYDQNKFTCYIGFIIFKLNTNIFLNVTNDKEEIFISTIDVKVQYFPLSPGLLLVSEIYFNMSLCKIFSI